MKRLIALIALGAAVAVPASAQIAISGGRILLKGGAIAILTPPSGGGTASTSGTFAPASGVTSTGGTPPGFSTAQGALSSFQIGSVTVQPTNWTGTMAITFTGGATGSASCAANVCTVSATAAVSATPYTMTWTSTP